MFFNRINPDWHFWFNAPPFIQASNRESFSIAQNHRWSQVQNYGHLTRRERAQVVTYDAIRWHTSSMQLSDSKYIENVIFLCATSQGGQHFRCWSSEWQTLPHHRQQRLRLSDKICLIWRQDRISRMGIRVVVQYSSLAILHGKPCWMTGSNADNAASAWIMQCEENNRACKATIRQMMFWNDADKQTSLSKRW